MYGTYKVCSVWKDLFNTRLITLDALKKILYILVDKSDFVETLHVWHLLRPPSTTCSCFIVMKTLGENYFEDKFSAVPM